MAKRQERQEKQGILKREVRRETGRESGGRMEQDGERENEGRNLLANDCLGLVSDIQVLYAIELNNHKHSQHGT